LSHNSINNAILMELEHYLKLPNIIGELVINRMNNN